MGFTKAPKQKAPQTPLLLQLARTGTLSVVFLLLFVFLAPGNLISEAAAFFVPQLIVAGFIGLMLWIIMAKALHWLHLACLLALALTSYWMVTSVKQVLQPVSLSKERTVAKLNVMSLNLLHMDYKANALQRLIEQQQPDLISFQETAGATPRLKAFLTQTYPHTLLPPNGHDTDITLFSKFPLKNAKRIQIPGLKPGPHIPNEFLSTTVDINGKHIQLYTIHPASPRGPNRLEGRTKYFDFLANHIKSQNSEHPIAILGDWNTPIWSNSFQRLLSDLKLTTIFAGNLPQTTRYFIHPSLKVILGSQVDHIVTSEKIVIKNLLIGSDIGSDHFPIFATLHIHP